MTLSRATAQLSQDSSEGMTEVDDIISVPVLCALDVPAIYKQASESCGTADNDVIMIR